MGEPIELIAGLGNPGPEYLLSRHNAGFWFVDALADAAGGRFTAARKLHGETADVEVAGRRLRLLKPMTYMNESGRSVAAALAYYKIPVERLLVVYDEIDLPAGTPRLKKGGGHAGHNGVRSVIEHIGPDFWRIRLGVGRPERGPRQHVVGHVLRRATPDDEARILEAVRAAAEALPVLLEHGAERAMTQLHTTKPAEPAGDAS